MDASKKNKKTSVKAPGKDLLIKKASCWEAWNEKTAKSAFDFAEEYKKFISSAKTEQECTAVGQRIAEKNGFKNIESATKLKLGDKVYAANRGKSLILARIGKDLAENGFKLVMSHIDSPHLDLKISPLYEDENLAFFKTHYYGGIKKYQWPTIALALHGKVYLENGQNAEVVIGEKESDPVFMITDLLPHLDRAGGPGSPPKAREIQGEDLNLLIGSIPDAEKKPESKAQGGKEKVKLAVLKYLNKEYGIKEEDLSSAELKAVPSEKARDLGFDRSLISAYGHDDRSCSYAALQSLVESEAGDLTQICYWVDREEIGSEGNTGAQSTFLEMFLSDILRLTGGRQSIDEVYRVCAKSQAISADVTVGVDPDYKDVHDLRNAHRVGYGVALEKYTGSGGKYNTSEASAEFIRDLRMSFKKDKNIVYQLGGGLGKIDIGGGGTIAMYMANLGMEIVDMGIPVFNMHAPLEIISKADLYAAFLAYKKFLA